MSSRAAEFMCGRRVNPPRKGLRAFCRISCATVFLIAGIHTAEAREIVDVITEDATRFIQLLDSPIAERRIEGIQGLSHLKYWAAEPVLLRHLADPSAEARRETVLALGRLGTGKAILPLIKKLDDPTWEIRRNAWLALVRMTSQTIPMEKSGEWEAWWKEGGPGEKEAGLLQGLSQAGSARAGASSRRDMLRALRHLATPGAEPALLEWLESSPNPKLEPDERVFLIEALERVGSARAVPVLARERNDAAAWALGRIGGPEAEQALWQFPKRLATWLALDRLRSTQAGPFIPELVSRFGLVTFRSQPDDLENRMPQPIQRAAANLILRTGHAPLLVEIILRELEETMQPPITNGPRPEAPSEWNQMLTRMREELKPGFVRNDGVTTSQPLTAMYFVAEDPGLAPRLIPLLRHPAFVPRIYAGLLLGKLGATEALPALVEIIEEGYPFSDAVELASGKHFDKSQTVRWRGFLCLALGRMGSDSARMALEQFALDPAAPRDIRYCAVVGLGFIGSEESLPALERIVAEDIIWMIRDSARHIAADIQLLREERAILR